MYFDKEINVEQAIKNRKHKLEIKEKVNVIKRAKNNKASDIKTFSAILSQTRNSNLKQEKI